MKTSILMRAILASCAIVIGVAAPLPSPSPSASSSSSSGGGGSSDGDNGNTPHPFVGQLPGILGTGLVVGGIAALRDWRRGKRTTQLEHNLARKQAEADVSAQRLAQQQKKLDFAWGLYRDELARRGAHPSFSVRIAAAVDGGGAAPSDGGRELLAADQRYDADMVDCLLKKMNLYGKVRFALFRYMSQKFMVFVPFFFI
jgi:hypothetical protein